jgi:hypothetical protein
MDMASTDLFTKSQNTRKNMQLEIWKRTNFEQIIYFQGTGNNKCTDGREKMNSK